MFLSQQFSYLLAMRFMNFVKQNEWQNEKVFFYIFNSDSWNKASVLDIFLINK